MAVSSSGLQMEEENDRLDLGEKKKRFQRLSITTILCGLTPY